MGGGCFEDENLTLKHDGPGYVAMANSGPDTNKSQFYITFRRTPWLDGTAVVFGKVWKGHDMLKKIEALGSEDGTTSKKISICASGEYDPVFEALKLEETKKAEAAMPQMFDDQRNCQDLEDVCTRLDPANKRFVQKHDHSKVPGTKQKRPPPLSSFANPF
eukprot:TRINITY_DN1596_c0_g1_i2.p1 TRINITY_DN1596_c0_g1~~TRINITY_DN1596_c0_g1_i2.p1  ORF type:complete len:161 (+),score=45.01 TRINITY_DN1596_c0_g1_i2:173-655(+)